MSAIEPVPQALSGWGNFPREACLVSAPTTHEMLRDTIASGTEANYIARGLGRAYGDSALNKDSGVLVQTGMNRFLAFDAESGILECEAGVSFAEIIDAFLPRGWFLPTTPGTKFVTVGGAIAADVHGKNHHQVGSFGNFVLSFQLFMADGNAVCCSRQESPELFWGTIGGMGLTGCILSARIQLTRVPSAFVAVNYRRTNDLEETLRVFSEEDRKYQYSVAWIDCLAEGAALGRSVVMLADNAQVHQLLGAQQANPHQLPKKFAARMPFNVPSMLVAPWSMRLFNKLYYWAHPDRTGTADFNSFFYPLDRIAQWNRIYGRRGFVQYQAWFPQSSSQLGLVEILQRIAASQRASFLAVLKSCGPRNEALLTYLEPGHTLALDFAYTGLELHTLFAELDRILLRHGGRLYMAKDAMTTPEAIHAMYPRLVEFQNLKRSVDPLGRFNSSQARRLKLV